MPRPVPFGTVTCFLDCYAIAPPHGKDENLLHRRDADRHGHRLAEGLQLLIQGGAVGIGAARIVLVEDRAASP